MSEPIRFHLIWRRTGRTSGEYVVSVPGLLPEDGDLILVREDHATETERERVEAWLEEHYGAAVRDLIGEWGGHEEWGTDARELLDILFGEEASRG